MRVLVPEDSAPEPVRLDVKDKRILTAWCRNCRLPVSRIAQIVRLKRHHVDYRLAQYRTRHVIKGTRTIINLRKFGYATFHVFMEFPSQEDETLLLKRALAHPSVNVVITYSGRYSLEVSFVARSPYEFLQMYQELAEGIRVLSDTMVMIVQTLKSQVLPACYEVKQPLLDMRTDSSFQKEFAQPYKEHALDALDLDIVRLLSDDATLSIAQISAQTKVSADAVRNRIANLIQSRYILQFVPVLNYAALRLSVHTLLLHMLFPSKEMEKEFHAYVASDPSVVWCAHTFGAYSHLLFITTSSLEEVHAFLNSFKQRFWSSIKRADTLYAYKEHKYKYFTETISLPRTNHNY